MYTDKDRIKTDSEICSFYITGSNYLKSNFKCLIQKLLHDVKADRERNPGELGWKQ